MNAIPPYSGAISDSLRSLVGEMGGIGSSRDKSSQSGYTWSRVSSTEIRAMVESSWIAARAIEQPAADMTSRWRTWQGRSSDVALIEAEEQRLDLQAKVAKALVLSARDGGSLVVIGVNSEDPRLPLDPATVGRGGLLWVQVLSRDQVSLGPLITDPASRWYGQPAEFRLSLADGTYVSVHPSRTALFTPSPALDNHLTSEPWSVSPLQRAYRPILDLEQTLRAIQHLLFESKQDIVQVEGLNQGVLNPSYRSAIISRFALANTMKGLFSTVLLDKNEEITTKQLNLGAGLPELVDRLMIGVCGALDIPSSRLFGRSSASGLQASTAGESDDERYFSSLASKQRNIVGPALRVLDECLLRSALGRKPRGNVVFYEWAPLWSERAETLAEVRLKHSQAVKNLADAGLVDRGALGKAVVSQSEDDGWLPALGQHVVATAKRTQPSMPVEEEE
ncbi:DUF1073 domain-containing protein [Dankookia rubra]|uniref:DUF1073 domain-containing protein n=1 Tax=Dankookia rubra TaxID=1442381 RepID=A0A4R5Q8L7_9PROT|nr:DUF1073 domain-containing protein [Dankookia rubra]TDH58808.1 DUF1073 domain-containing protein [Dankookia rubra]